ncbi:MAG: Fic family protein [Nanoarchaeota archaeon]|nr:Fic family protein [Nanoarchaeota archaeon]
MWINKVLYKRILEKKKRLSSLRPFDKYQMSIIKEQMDVEYIYNSTTIEGNTLTLNETKLVLEQGITISGKSLREHLDIINQKDTIRWLEDFVKSKKQNIAEADILQLHRITLRGISDYWAGRYKTSQNRIIGSKLKTTPPYRVKSEIENFIYNLNKNKDKLNNIELSAFAHHEIERIHPFIDGNGRTARLVTNLILMKHGYLPIIIQNSERKKYFNALEKAHFGDMKPFANFIARNVERSLIIVLNALIPTTKDNELIALSELAKETKYSQEYLSLRARQGELAAVKILGVWHTSRDDLRNYIKSLK